jgi:hypothetical protein
MLADFRQKEQIIAHVARRRNWRDDFDTAFLTDPNRKTKTSLINGLSVSYSLFDSVINIERTDIDISIEIKRIGIGLGIVLPDGRVLMLSQTPLLFTNRKKISLGSFDPKGERYAHIQDFMIAIDENGVIDLQLPELNQSAIIHPLKAPQRSVIKQGRFFHKISFNHHTHGKKWGLEPETLLMAAKLIIARELGIEPDLHAINAFDEDSVVPYLAERAVIERDLSTGMPPQWSPFKDKPIDGAHLLSLQKAWSDSSDFEGHRIETPRLFCIRKGDKGYDFYVGLDHKQQLLTLGHVTLQALRNDQRPTNIFGNKENFSTLLHTLEHGAETTDPEGNLWKYAFIAHEEAAAFAQRLRQQCHGTYGINRQDMLTLAVEPDCCLMMMRAKAIEPVKTAFHSTVALARMLEKNSDDTEMFKAYLQQGADIRYLDRDLRESQNPAFLRALRL